MTFSNRSDKKGFGFEYTVSHMFQNQGFLTRRGIPLQYGPANQDATDIDVLGIMFTSPFQGHKIICDCKNKVRSKPYERIFWAKGLGEFVKASNVFVALPKTQWEVIKFASIGNVKILTSDILAQYVNSSTVHGLADASFYKEYENIVEKVAKTDKLVSKILTSTKKLYLDENPYLVINIALTHLEKISKSFIYLSTLKNEQIMTLKYLASELAVIVGLQIMWICSDVLGLPDSARRRHIKTKLTFGELDPEVVKNIMQDAKDLANEIVKSSVPKSVAPKEVDFGEITPPPYTESLIGLIERALARPQMYISMPQVLDFLLFEQGLKGLEYSEEDFYKKFGHSKTDEKVKASKNILSFIRDTCGINWNQLWGMPKSVDTDQVESNKSKTPVEPKVEKVENLEVSLKTRSVGESNKKVASKKEIAKEEQKKKETSRKKSNTSFIEQEKTILE